jgi:hypothetical protein
MIILNVVLKEMLNQLNDQEATRKQSLIEEKQLVLFVLVYVVV